MKVVKIYSKLVMVLVFGLVLSAGVFAQVESGEKEPEKIAKIEKKDDSLNLKNAETPKVAAANEQQDPDDETETVVGQYRNYLSEYRMGPNDIISIEVFGQCPDYCRTDVTVNPTARISYPLIREGIFVGGKTVT
ncbi:MAG: polysaccharide biosynthesis/export family protein, partial [Acidobacteria bacterium]|nr:polysaccharide biosynthesis/export family protein [Acidobacteriota bacterium]